MVDFDERKRYLNNATYSITEARHSVSFLNPSYLLTSRHSLSNSIIFIFTTFTHQKEFKMLLINQMVSHLLLITIFAAFYVFRPALAVELTFELPDNAKQCFHEDIRQGVESTVEFQVCC